MNGSLFSQILMSVPPGKTTAQRTRCALTHTVVSSAFVWTVQKSLMPHMSKHHQCEYLPSGFFFLSWLCCFIFSQISAQMIFHLLFEITSMSISSFFYFTTGIMCFLLTIQSSTSAFLSFHFLSSRRCERNPCPVDNKACSQAPNSFSYHYLAVVSNLSAPRVMFRVSALRPIGDTLRFSLLGGKQARRHFTVQRSDRQTGQLMLASPVHGPATLEAEVEMSELENRVQIGRYITKVTMFVSQYEF